MTASRKKPRAFWLRQNGVIQVGKLHLTVTDILHSRVKIGIDGSQGMDVRRLDAHGQPQGGGAQRPDTSQATEGKKA